MTLKLIYLFMDWGTYNKLLALEQVRGVIRTFQACTVKQIATLI